MANSLANNISRIFGLTGCGRRLFLTQSRSFYAYSAEPFHPVGDRQPKWCSADEAVSVIKSNDKVFLHGGAATPLRLTKAMAEHGKRAGLKNVKMFHIHTEGPGEFAHPDCAGIFRSNSLFIGGNCRIAINEGRADFTPIFLSEIPLLFRRKIVELDVALIHVTPPDKHGNCSMGVSVDCARAAVQNSKYLVGLINPQMPRTFGDGIIHISHFDAVAETDEPLPELKIKPSTPEETAIGQLIAGELVDNGATLQMGIGSVPDAALAAMTNHKDLGVHSEMFSDGVVDLVHCGALTNAKKVIQTGKIVSSFCIGTKKLFDFLRDNPLVVMLEINYTNSTAVICQNPKVTAINSCIEVDLTGQVVSDSIGTRMYSGVGGQVDFIRGAGLSLDGLGKPILALPSQTKKGESKIVPYVKQGSGVVTSRAHVHYIVTEYGIAYLFGKNIRQRAYELIKIAHPNHRESLEKAAFERLKAMPSPD